MKRFNFFVNACALSVVLTGCGTPEPAISEACTTQLTADDCEMIGNNVLSFTKGMENYECAWVENACTLRQK